MSADTGACWYYALNVIRTRRAELKAISDKLTAEEIELEIAERVILQLQDKTRNPSP